MIMIHYISSKCSRFLKKVVSKNMMLTLTIKVNTVKLVGDNALE